MFVVCVYKTLFDRGIEKVAVLYDALLDYGVLDEFIYFLALFLSSRLNLWFTVIKLIFVVFVVVRV